MYGVSVKWKLPESLCESEIELRVSYIIERLIFFVSSHQIRTVHEVERDEDYSDHASKVSLHSIPPQDQTGEQAKITVKTFQVLKTVL